MNSKKIIALFLAVIFAVASFSGCGSAKKGQGIQFSDEQLALYSHIPQADLEGYNFRILNRKGMVDSQFVEAETGDIIKDAVYRRNETVKALLNCNITSVESSTSNADDALNTILAGDNQYDIIFPHTRTAFNYAVQNAVVDFTTIDTLNLSNEWWSQDIIGSCTVNGHLYVLDGDISVGRLSAAFCMYFNKRIFDEMGIEYPYQLALDGEWTFDQFAKLVKQGSKDLNGDGLMKPDHDQYGYYTMNWYGPINVLYTGGQRIYKNNKRGIPELSLNSAKTVDIFSKFFALTDTDDVRLFVQKANETDPAGDLFREGRAMFADRGLGSAKSLRNMSDDFGILPWPKFSKDDVYATIVNGAASLMVVPITVPDLSTTGMIIEALGAVGHDEVVPAFYDVSLKTKFSRDAESESMIDIVKNSIIYDLGYASGGTFQSIGHDLAGMSNPDFASYYASNESRAIASLNDFIKSYGS